MRVNLDEYVKLRENLPMMKVDEVTNFKTKETIQRLIYIEILISKPSSSVVWTLFSDKCVCTDAWHVACELHVGFTGFHHIWHRSNEFFENFEWSLGIQNGPHQRDSVGFWAPKICLPVTGFSKNLGKLRISQFWTSDILQKPVSTIGIYAAIVGSGQVEHIQCPKLFFSRFAIENTKFQLYDTSKWAKSDSISIKMKSERSSQKQHFFSHFKQFQLIMRCKVLNVVWIFEVEKQKCKHFRRSSYFNMVHFEFWVIISNFRKIHYSCLARYAENLCSHEKCENMKTYIFALDTSIWAPSFKLRSSHATPMNLCTKICPKKVLKLPLSSVLKRASLYFRFNLRTFQNYSVLWVFFFESNNSL